MGCTNVLSVYSHQVPRMNAGSSLLSYGYRSERRIIRMMHQRGVRSLSFSRKMLLNLASSIAMLAPVVFNLVPMNQARAQATAPTQAQDIAGTWQGTLHAGQDLRTVLKVTKAADGSYKADFYSIDQGGQPFPVTKISLDAATVKY